jgi:hypothetical protein
MVDAVGGGWGRSVERTREEPGYLVRPGYFVRRSNRPPSLFLKHKLVRYDVESGRYYGYSEKVIRRFIEERYGRRMAWSLLGR